MIIKNDGYYDKKFITGGSNVWELTKKGINYLLPKALDFGKKQALDIASSTAKSLGKKAVDKVSDTAKSKIKKLIREKKNNSKGINNLKDNTSNDSSLSVEAPTIATDDGLNRGLNRGLGIKII